MRASECSWSATDTSYRQVSDVDGPGRTACPFVVLRPVHGVGLQITGNVVRVKN